MRVGTSIADLTSGLMAAQGILLALYAREKAERGQRLSISMLDAMASLLTYNTGYFFASGQSPTRCGNEHPSVAPYQTLRAADGWMNLGIANDSLWARDCEAIDHPGLVTDPRFATALCTNPQLMERGKVVERPHPTAETVKMIGLPIELSDTAGTIARAAPLLGEHTDEVLRDVGYSAEEIREFRANGIV